MTSVLGEWFTAHLAEVYVVYGGSFLLLGVTLAMQPKEDEALRFAPDLWLIALFALLHGAKELLDAWRYAQHAQHLPGPRDFGAVLLAVSFLPLFEFGRRLAAATWTAAAARGGLGYWIYLPTLGAVMLTTAFSTNGAAALEAASRPLVGLPGASLTVLGLLGYLRRERERVDAMNSARSIGFAAGALFAYGLFAGLVVNAPLPAVALPDAGAFARVTGFPVELFRTACALGIAFSLARLLRQANVEARRRERQALNKVRTLNLELEQRVRQRTVELEAANALLHEAQEIGRVGNWVLDPATQKAEWSDQQYRLLGYAPGAVEPGSASFLRAVHPEDRSAAAAEMLRVMHPAETQPYHLVHRVVTPVGERILEERGRVTFDERGKPLRVSGTTADVTEAQQARRALEQALEELRATEQRQRELRVIAQREQGRMAALLSAMNIGILFEDQHQRVEYLNPAFRRIWAIPETEEVIGVSIRDLISGSRRQFAHPAHASKYVLQVLDTHEASERFELELADERVLTQFSYPVLDSSGQALGRLWVYEDITHERKTAKQLLYLAERDPLTGLYNRHRFQTQLDHMLTTAARNASKFALLYFDLDEFKTINDTFGHRAGDSVLVRIAGELAGLVRAGDTFARVGGDEFAVISTWSAGDQPGGLPARIIESISSIPFRFGGRNLRLTASVGVAIYPDHGTDGEDLVAHADAAMYFAKSQGKNTWATYDPSRDMSEAMIERMSWTQRIAQALERQAFELHYQGVYATDGRALRHLEALVRMRDPAHPERLILPGQFVSIAEKSGQILEIDRWVVRRCVEQLARHPSVPAIAVNISARSLDDASLPQFIRARLEAQGVEPRRLIVELTETAAVSDLQDAQRFIEALRQLGCKVCLDDFGSGFSTFVYLKHLDVEILKIDGVFIQDLPRDTENQALVKAMVDIARALGKTCVAEFVEDAATLALVRRLGVDLAQGYHLDQPVADHPAFAEL